MIGQVMIFKSNLTWWKRVNLFRFRVQLQVAIFTQRFLNWLVVSYIISSQLLGVLIKCAQHFLFNLLGTHMAIQYHHFMVTFHLYRKDFSAHFRVKHLGCFFCLPIFIGKNHPSWEWVFVPVFVPEKKRNAKTHLSSWSFCGSQGHGQICSKMFDTSESGQGASCVPGHILRKTWAKHLIKSHTWPKPQVQLSWGIFKVVNKNLKCWWNMKNHPENFGICLLNMQLFEKTWRIWMDLREMM